MNDQSVIASSTNSKSNELHIRTLSACIRCKKRKRKCDPGLPRCNLCHKANVECEFYDEIGKNILPRSYIYNLEKRLRDLEDQLQQVRQLKQKSHKKTKSDRMTANYKIISEVSEWLIEIPDEKQAESVAPLIDIVPVDWDKSDEKLVLGLSSRSNVIRALMDRISSKTESNNVSSNESSNTQTFNSFNTKAHYDSIADHKINENNKSRTLSVSLLPLKTFSYLVSMFLQLSEVRHPIFIHSELVDLIADVYNNIKTDSHSVCIVNLIVAIGLQISANNDIQSSTLAEKYYQEALNSFKDIITYSKNVRTVQCILLVIAYSFVSPTSAPVWHLSGIVMRMLMDMGLHREDILLESVDDSASNALILDWKRKLWWSTYSLDRGISFFTHHPLSIEDQMMTTEYSSVLEDSCISSHSDILQVNLIKAVSNHMIRLRQLHSEIITKLYTNPEQRVTITDSWFSEIHRKLLNWFENKPMSLSGPLKYDWFCHGLSSGIILVYKPSPCNPNPSQRSYVTCFEAASSSIVLYRGVIDKKIISASWLSCHFLFFFAITLLYAYYFSPDVRAKCSIADLNDMLEFCGRVFKSMTTRWPVAKELYNEFRKLATLTWKTYGPEININQAWPSFYNDESIDNAETDSFDFFAAFGAYSDMAHCQVLNSKYSKFPFSAFAKKYKNEKN